MEGQYPCHNILRTRHSDYTPISTDMGQLRRVVSHFDLMELDSEGSRGEALVKYTFAYLHLSASCGGHIGRILGNNEVSPREDHRGEVPHTIRQKAQTTLQILFSWAGDFNTLCRTSDS